MHPDMSSSNIAFLLYVLYTITPYRRRLSITIIDWKRWRERERQEKRRGHLLHHIDLNNDDGDLHHHHFLICPQRTWWVCCHLVTPLDYILKMSFSSIEKKIEEWERIDLSYLDLMRDLSDIFLLFSSFCSYFSQSILLCQWIGVYVTQVNVLLDLYDWQEKTKKWWWQRVTQ